MYYNITIANIPTFPNCSTSEKTALCISLSLTAIGIIIELIN